MDRLYNSTDTKNQVEINGVLFSPFILENFSPNITENPIFKNMSKNVLNIFKMIVYEQNIEKNNLTIQEMADLLNFLKSVFPNTSIFAYKLLKSKQLTVWDFINLCSLTDPLFKTSDFLLEDKNISLKDLVVLFDFAQTTKNDFDFIYKELKNRKDKTSVELKILLEYESNVKKYRFFNIDGKDVEFPENYDPKHVSDKHKFPNTVQVFYFNKPIKLSVGWIKYSRKEKTVLRSTVYEKEIDLEEIVKNYEYKEGKYLNTFDIVCDFFNLSLTIDIEKKNYKIVPDVIYFEKYSINIKDTFWEVQNNLKIISYEEQEKLMGFNGVLSIIKGAFYNNYLSEMDSYEVNNQVINCLGKYHPMIIKGKLCDICSFSDMTYEKQQEASCERDICGYYYHEPHSGQCYRPPSETIILYDRKRLSETYSCHYFNMSFDVFNRIRMWRGWGDECLSFTIEQYNKQYMKEPDNYS